MKSLTFALFTLSLVSAPLVGSVLLEENFPGTSLNTSVWTSDGIHSQVITVSNGTLTLRVAGGNHWALVRTLEEYNFHEESHSFTVDLASFDEPDWDGAGEWANAELYFAVGPASNRDHLVSSNNRVTGFHFALRWTRSGVDIRTRSSVGISGTGLSAVPEQVTFTLDATSYTIVLDGATFSSTGTNTLTGNHGLSEYSDNNFTILYTQGDIFYLAPGGVINSVLIESTGLAGPPGAPTGLTATAGDGEVVLDWNTVAGVDSYNVKRAELGEPLQMIANTPTPGYVDADVVNGVTYEYAVAAVSDVYGEGAESAIARATPHPEEGWWAGFEIDENGWVDTADWLGLLHVEHSPWVYAASIDGWIYFGDFGSDGSWIFFTNPAESRMQTD